MNTIEVIGMIIKAGILSLVFLFVVSFVKRSAEKYSELRNERISKKRTETLILAMDFYKFRKKEIQEREKVCENVEKIISFCSESIGCKENEFRKKLSESEFKYLMIDYIFIFKKNTKQIFLTAKKQIEKGQQKKSSL